MKYHPLTILFIAIALITSCGPSDEELSDAISEHMVRLGMANGNDYHAIKVELLEKGDEKNGEIPVLAVVTGGISPSGLDQGVVVPSPFSDTLKVVIIRAEGRWEVQGPTSK